MRVKTYFVPQRWSSFIDTESQATLPGRGLTKTVIPASGRTDGYERYDRSDFVSLSEFPAPFIDSLNNAYDIPGHVYELPMSVANDKATIYLPFFKEDFECTIKDVILDVNATLGYDSENRVITLENIEPVIGDIVFKTVYPTTAQSNNPATGNGVLNFDRATVGISVGTVQKPGRLRINADYTARRTLGYLSNGNSRSINGLAITSQWDFDPSIAPTFFNYARPDTTFATIHKYYTGTTVYPLQITENYNSYYSKWYFEEQIESGSGSGS